MHLTLHMFENPNHSIQHFFNTCISMSVCERSDLSGLESVPEVVKSKIIALAVQC